MRRAPPGVLSGVLALMSGLFAVGAAPHAAWARTIRIDTHAQLVKRLMERHRAGTRYRFGARLKAAADLDADWIVIRNGPLLRRLTWLRTASLSRATLPGFAFLRLWTGLRGLDLSKTRIRSLRCLSGLSHLRELDLSATAVSDLRPLAGLKSLMDLRLSETRITDLSPLQSMALARLELGGPRLKKLPRLSTLAVDKLVITDATARLDFSPLAKARITYLVLDATAVVQLKGLAGHPTLAGISLRNTRVTLDTIRKLLKKNRSLQVVTPKGRTVGQVIRWVRARPRLSNYPCLLGTGACQTQTFGWERRRVIHWIAP